ncbi:hypothetical protein [Bacillus methanolicus]|uniref:hypothetical protein n=1 Tax=Bacillus methanolicus TaxID=1471 RepID=UPI00237FF011|nr:hypothetical protein [Bacillus methanolicus]
MNFTEKKRILDVLNSLEVIEENGGDECYLLVENNEENHKKLNDVGVSSETINKYGDEETFCILSLAFSEGYCDLYDGDKLIVFDKCIEVEVKTGKFVVLYKHDGDFHLSVFEDGGSVSTSKLTDDQVSEIKNVIA